MGKRILGIDVGHDTLKLALVNGNKVEKTVAAPIPLNLIQDNRVVSEESMGEFIRSTMRENGIHCSEAAYVLSNENIYSRTVKMPKMTADQLRINLPYEFSDFISDEPSKYLYDYAMLPNEDEEDEGMSLMAIAMQKEHLESVRRFMKKAGLKLVKVAPTMNAFISIIRRNKDQEKEYCILDLGHRAIRMHIFKGERYEVTRTLDVGLSVLDNVIAENLNVDVHLAHTYLISDYENCQRSEYCMSAYENITMELMRALNFYRFSNPDSKLEDVYFCGGGIQIDPLREVIRQSLDLNIHHARELLPASMSTHGMSTYMQAIGITFDAKERNGVSRGKTPTKRVINLADAGEEKIDKKTAAAAIILIIVAATLFSIYGVAGRFAKLYKAQSETNKVQHELDEAYKSLSDYNMTEDQYAHYTFEGMTTEELAQVEREDVLKLLDEKVIGKCEVEYWSVSENILNLRIVGSTLEEVNTILQGINQDELVSYSTVSTARKEDKTDSGSKVSVTADIVVYLNGRTTSGEE
ncbi:MAG: pilus assembly protein PilM [Lachnospiraceae bacterium]|nr:pilus assembly protein PilM [Lachnospiraceae bacterium]